MKKIISKKGYAKINLAIDVLGKLSNGYHLVDMIMHSIELYDEVKVNLREDKKIVVVCDELSELAQEENIVFKACKLFQKKYNVYKGVDIHISKKIPIQAGLAGGSADAAATLECLNELFEINVPLQELQNIAKDLGADVPFALQKGNARATHIGEALTRLECLGDVYVILVKPPVGAATGRIYNRLDKTKINRRPNIDDIIEKIKNKNLVGLKEDCYNVLEPVTKDVIPQIEQVENLLEKTKPLLCMMSGSGPTVFALYNNLEIAKEVVNTCREQLYDCEVILTKTYSK